MKNSLSVSQKVKCSSAIVVQSISRVQLFVSPWTVACKASLSLTISWSVLKFMPIESMMPWTQTWTWADSRRWWGTGRPCVLQSKWSQRVRDDWVTEQQRQWDIEMLLLYSSISSSIFCTVCSAAKPALLYSILNLELPHSLFQIKLVSSGQLRTSVRMAWLSPSAESLCYCSRDGTGTFIISMPFPYKQDSRLGAGGDGALLVFLVCLSQYGISAL